MLNVITGATGQLGSHIAEQIAARGQTVRALVRPGSDVEFLQSLGAELIEGDLQSKSAVDRAMAGADVVYHCAARVSDWGSWPTFRDEAQLSTSNLLAACTDAKVGRLLHVSSISVYGNPPGDALITEDAPLGVKFRLWDYYPRAKLLAEEMVRTTYRRPWTIVRPSWIYGPRDRVTIPRVVSAIREKRVPIIGTGDNLLNIIFAGDVARGAIVAANDERSEGEVYNLCSLGEVTQRQMLDTLCDALSLPRITKRVPFGVVRQFAFVREAIAKMLGSATPPPITRRAVYLVGRPTQFSIDKAWTRLGWRPEVDIKAGVKQTLEWFHASGKLQSA